jgi:hypothetical protein
MTTCINLLALFGRDYRITFDPAYDPFHVPKDKLDPWMMQIPCERGIIYPFGGDRLAVEIDYRGPTARAVGALPGVVLHQDGDREKTFLFPLALFDKVAALVQPRKRRRLSPERRAALAEANAATRFRPQHGVQGNGGVADVEADAADGPRVA